MSKGKHTAPADSTASRRNQHATWITAAIVLAVVLALLLMSMFSRSAAAQGFADAGAGRVLAERLCVSCHAIGGGAASGPIRVDVPGFTSIANRPGQTVEAIAGKIVVPHPEMPQIQLTRNEIASLAAYIMSLRKP